MRIYKNSPASDWPQLITRPASNSGGMEDRIQALLHAVKNQGDQAVYDLTRQLDGVSLSSLEVTHQEKAVAAGLVDDQLKADIRQVQANITTFHQAQREVPRIIETMPGVQCWRRSVPIQRVGLYVPGGTAPLFSTVLMLGVPAILAGCPEIIICTPPAKDGTVHPAILYTAELIGIHHIYKIGGAQAIAAMAYGTETIPRVAKLFGPGNQYVTVAKQLISREGIAIDMPAGPSEVLILADATANPAFIAADLLAQAEHGPDSQCLLVTTSEPMLHEVANEVARQLEGLSRQAIARESLKNGRLVFVPDLAAGIALTNLYAPEHLIIATEEAETVAMRVYNAGSVFLGNLTPVTVGDYASGTNHTLPTNGFAATFSGVSLDSFIKKITYQQLSPEGLRLIGPLVERMALAEELMGHGAAISLRLQTLIRS
ncbi:histidinol dehydrogenase [Spirosoma spitsbergense]|uniref:histidinol dehydrogenase n=1 Tax=Spirosoma spitsbergense TaxID=431554 RepID=UPI0003626F05|nr:histidinol dehydrogenase [Spirosoma spitsbergense]